MATQFLNKQNIQIQPSKAPKSLALTNDIMGLLESTTKTMGTYNQIGENAAKIQYQEDSNVASQKLTILKTSMVEAKAANDTTRMEQIEADMNAITTGIVAKADDFSGHKAAYDAYHGLAIDYSATVQSTWSPLLKDAYLTASKENKMTDDITSNESSATIGMAVTDSLLIERESINDNLNIDKMVMSGKAFDTNHSKIVGEVSKNMSQTADYYKLFKKDENGNMNYDYQAESSMVENVYGGRYFIDQETGQVATTSKYATTEEMAKVSGLIGNVRQQLMKVDGTFRHPRFDALASEVGSVIDALGTGVGTVDVKNNKAFNEFMAIPDASLDEGRVNQRNVLKQKLNIQDTKSTDARATMNYFMSNSDATSIRMAMEYGHNGIPASDIKRAVTQYGGELNAKVNSAMLSNNQALPAIYDNALRESYVLGITLEATARAANISSGSVQAVSSKEMESAIMLERVKLNVGNLSGQGYASTVELNYRQKILETKSMQIDAKRKELSSQGLKPAEVESRLTSYIHGLNKAGAEDKDVNIKTNAYHISQITMADTDYYKNLGFAVSLTNSQKKYYAVKSADAGIKFGSGKEATEWIAENLYRKSEFNGVAQYVPQGINDEGFEAIRASAYKKAGIPLNDATKKYMMFLAPEQSGEKTFVTPTIYPTGGKPLVVSSKYDVATVGNIKNKVDVTYRDGSMSTAKPTYSSEQLKIQAQKSEETARKGLTPYYPTPTNKTPTRRK